MKPITLEFVCFGPYMEGQFVNFEDLERDGLFLICGETGAGKTTILDAMCMALYGRASGGARGELPDMRCKLADKDDVTRVEFVFDNGGRRYKFLRVLRRVKTRDQEEVKYDEEQQCMELLGGEWKPLLANAKKTAVNEMAEQIIGLTYDQFRQVIILPQGQFERLLTSKSDEKEEILTKLFHAERWERAVQRIYDQVSAQDDELKRELEGIKNELHKHVDDCDSLDGLRQKKADAEAELKELQKQAQTAATTVETLEKRKTRALLDDKAFKDLDMAEGTLDNLQKQVPSVVEEEKLLGMADEAERLWPIYDKYAQAKKTLKEKMEEADSAQKKLEEAESAAEEKKNAREAHEAGREEYKAKKDRLPLLKNAVGLYQTLSDKLERRDAADKQLQTAKTQDDQCGQKLKAADERLGKAVEKQRAAMEAYQRGQRAYLQGIGGVLAQKLVQGEPCPVCGSREHPAPAAMSEGHITDSELDELSEAMDQANREEKDAREARKSAEDRKKETAEALEKAQAKQAQCQAEYDSAKAGMLEGIDTSEELERAIQATDAAIQKFDREETSTVSALQAAQMAAGVAEAEAGRLQEELAKVQEEARVRTAAWQEALKASQLEDEAQFTASRLEPEERQQRQQACADFRGQLKAAGESVEEKRAAVEGKAKPILEAVEAALEEAKEDAEQCRDKVVRAEAALESMGKTLEALTARKKDHDEKRVHVDRNMEFAKRLRGSAGVSLQRYVLGVRFAAVTAEANRLLETIYGGRYRLYRTDEASGRTLKKGLELEVYDTTQGQRRSVNTLSGGEKFLVALSLAIGLSSVVRSGGGGVHMEAMFVDEGFGSLDDSAVDDAVSILQGIRQQSGAVVGVISHVGRLEETIPTKLEVKKERKGSRIVLQS